MENCTPTLENADLRCEKLLLSVGDALYAIGGKWKLRVIISLSVGSRRFNDLQRSIPGISARMLANELRELEMNGFVNRNINTTAMPVIVLYELDEYSQTLKNVVNALSDWGIMHRQTIKKKVNNVKLKSLFEGCHQPKQCLPA